jgi:prepilin-type N-terminal cleavage/methylation domain-containing protein
MKKFQILSFWFQVLKFKIQPFESFRVDPERSRTGQNSKFKTETGFTLLEIVVAMAIVGLGVVTLLAVFSQGLRLETASSARTEAVAYSRQAFDTFLVQRSFDTRGDSGSFGRTHSWRIDVDPVRDNSQNALAGWEVSEITLRMRYPEAERDKFLEMKTLRIVKRKEQ